MEAIPLDQCHHHDMALIEGLACRILAILGDLAMAVSHRLGIMGLEMEDTGSGMPPARIMIVEGAEEDHQEPLAVVVRIGIRRKFLYYSCAILIVLYMIVLHRSSYFHLLKNVLKCWE